MKNVSTRRLFWLIAFGLLLTLRVGGARGQALPSGAAGAVRPVREALNPDGTFRPNIRGSFDPAGYQVRTDPATGQPAFQPTNVDDANWDSRFGRSDFNGLVNTVAILPNGDLVIGGAFFQLGGNPKASGVARWDGTAWQGFGAGLTGSVNALVVTPGGDIVVGGDFLNAGGNLNATGIARWDGAAWQALGAGVANMDSQGDFDGSIYALAIAANGDIVAGGSFYDAGNNPAADYLARWNGVDWRPFSGGPTAAVYALAVTPNGDLLAGGDFTDAGGNPAADYVARWTGTGWQALGGGLNAHVAAIGLASNGEVLVGGRFDNAGGDPNADKVARWTGTSWQPLGAGLNSHVLCLAVAANGDVLVGGDFTDAGGAPAADRVARWRGGAWQAVGPGLNGRVLALATAPNGEVVVGGTFYYVDGNRSILALTRWDGAAWCAFRTTNWNGLDGLITTVIAAPNGDVYVSGGFNDASGNPAADNIARWDGVCWQPLGSGLPNGVFSSALAPNGDIIAVTEVVDSTRQLKLAVMRWNGTVWQQLGTNRPNGMANVVVTPTGDIVVGGGGYLTGWVHRWTGTGWQSMGAGFNSWVNHLAVAANGEVLACGDFAGRVVRWTGTAWQPVGGISGDVYELAIAPNGDIVAACGYGVAGWIRRWDGTTWRQVGSSFNDRVTSVAVAPNGDILAGGGFRNNPSAPGISCIARWNGTRWQALGSGLDTYVRALAFAPNGDLLAGGEFSRLGTPNSGVNYGKEASHFGIYHTTAVPTLLSFTPGRATAGTSITITGTHFTGATAVSFGGTPAASFMVLSDSSLTATVPAGATSGLLSISTPNGPATSGCTLFTVANAGPTGLADAPTSGRAYLTLYPNPTQDYVTVQVSNWPPGTTHPAVQVFDALGRQLRFLPVADAGAAVTLRALAPGLYVVRCGALTRRLVVE